jgi:inosine/xanthosine triphosphatase
MIKKVIVASENIVKINAVQTTFQKIFPSKKFEFQGTSVSSGVKDQPLSNQETITGAINRCNNAKIKFPQANFWIGIEGGIEKINNEMEVFAWIIIKSEKMIGKAKTGTFFLPQKIVELINTGKELGEADDIVFGQKNSKQKSGSVGLLTKDAITRTDYYIEAIILALIPFKNPKIY